MMKYCTRILSGSFLVLFLFISISHAAPGFFTDKQILPDAVHAQLDGVFEIFAFHPQVQTIIFEKEDVDDYRSSVESKATGHNRAWRIYDLKSQGDGPIEIRRGVSVGSGFMIQGSDRLLTARHVVTDILTSVHLGQEIEVMVVDYLGRVVFDSRKDQYSARIGYIGVAEDYDPRLASWSQEDKNVAVDFLELRLSHDLDGSLLELAESTPKIGDTVYQVGYPTLTTGRQLEFGVPDSKGDRQTFSVGKVIEVSKSYYDFLKEKSTSEDALDAFLEARIFTDIDAAPGSTGGAIFNKSGKLVGMQTRSFSNGTTSILKAYGSSSNGNCFEYLAYIVRAI